MRHGSFFEKCIVDLMNSATGIRFHVQVHVLDSLQEFKTQWHERRDVNKCSNSTAQNDWELQNTWAREHRGNPKPPWRGGSAVCAEGPHFLSKAAQLQSVLCSSYLADPRRSTSNAHSSSAFQLFSWALSHLVSCSQGTRLKTHFCTPLSCFFSTLFCCFQLYLHSYLDLYHTSPQLLVYFTPLDSTLLYF